MPSAVDTGTRRARWMIRGKLAAHGVRAPFRRRALQRNRGVPMTATPGIAATVPLKSMLFVPGDSEKKLGKAMHVGASALILDLEDAVPVDRSGIARGMVRGCLAQHSDRATTRLWGRSK